MEPKLLRSEQRASCPRCNGRGKTHTSQTKHDTKQTCKKCEICAVCDGSGFVINKQACSTCGARGFIHPKYSIGKHVFTVNGHPAPASVICIDCIDCAACQGNGVFDGTEDQNALQSSYIYQTFTNQPILTLPSTDFEAVDLLHPHLLASFIPNYFTSKSTEKLEILNSVLKAQNIPIVPFNKKEKTACPICSGLGFKHTAACLKDKKIKTDVKCGKCVDCVSCKGSGLVTGMVACTLCSQRGFIHSAAVEHDAPAELRCFYCTKCSDCDGTLLVPKSN